MTSTTDFRNKTERIISQEFQSFVNARQKPAIFLLMPDERLDWSHAFAIRRELDSKTFEELDLVIHSNGGSSDTAYQVIQMLRLHAKKINACVPLFAKSAATLLCIGSDKIVLDELAQLGPLDPQIYVGDGERESALNAFKNLEELTNFSRDTLYDITVMLKRATELSVGDCIKYAIQFVEVVSGPLLTQLNLNKLGEYSRALSVSKEYSDRLLGRIETWDSENLDKVIKKLVYGYPSHGYVIDYCELKNLGFQVELFPPELKPILEIIFRRCLSLENTEILLVEPSDCSETPSDPADFLPVSDLNSLVPISSVKP